ncbi:MAG: glycerol-3-phosphate 1-O-acyltransferase PlsY, partial [Thiovulaceae bacterium]|nr:glycerol-3-phosphate 1-O-acyltransferase PlsY [Sulfurimonadaceae bacterium]
MEILLKLVDFITSVNGMFYIAAYLIGGIPFGVIIAKKFAGVDVRASGSQSIGATNVLRVVKEKDPKLAKKLSLATFTFDAVKGALIIAIAMLTDVPEATYWTIAILAILGHCFSPFLKFHGGKGVATAIGAFLVLLPIEALVGLGVWIIVAKTLKISSISSLSGVLAAVISSFFISPEIAHAPAVIIGF